MSKQDKVLAIQNFFLENLKESKKVVEIHLINGIILKCKILNIDNLSIKEKVSFQSCCWRKWCLGTCKVRQNENSWN